MENPGNANSGHSTEALLAAYGANERARVLKHAETFAVLDHQGAIKPGGLGEEGLYCDDTRFLSLLLMDLDGKRLFFLGSTVPTAAM